VSIDLYEGAIIVLSASRRFRASLIRLGDSDEEDSTRRVAYFDFLSRTRARSVRDAGVLDNGTCAAPIVRLATSALPDSPFFARVVPLTRFSRARRRARGEFRFLPCRRSDSPMPRAAMPRQRRGRAFSRNFQRPPRLRLPFSRLANRLALAFTFAFPSYTSTVRTLHRAA